MIRRAPNGFTLVEILVAMFVLVIGLASVMSVLIAAKRVSRAAIDRNLAKTIISEAIAGIESAHLVTASTAAKPEDAGLFIETIPTVPAATPGAYETPSVHDSAYGAMKLAANDDGSSESFSAHLNSYASLACFKPALNAAKTCTLIWPFGLYKNAKGNWATRPKLTGGFPAPTLNKDDTRYGYRVIYRLERHGIVTNTNPAPGSVEDQALDYVWHPHTADGSSWASENTNSPYTGIYVLTLAVYRDLTRTGENLEQVTDPVVVWLRDRKVRP